MIVDLSKFAPSLRLSVQAIFLSREEEGRKRILDISDALSVPCIVIAFWCGEVSDWAPHLKHSVDVLMAFYGYKEIQNKPEGCPW